MSDFHRGDQALYVGESWGPWVSGYTIATVASVGSDWVELYAPPADNQRFAVADVLLMAST